MLNRNSSARTAAQKSSKCSSLIRPATIAAILMLAAGLILSSCEMPKEKNAEFVEYYNYGNVRVIDIDSCQYVLYNVYGGYSITHKGNCKYCLTRKK